MRHKGRALTESFMLHGLLAGAMIVLAGALAPPPQAIRLDFSISQQNASPVPKMETQQKTAAVAPSVPSAPMVQPPPPVPQPRPKVKEARVSPQKPKPIPVKTKPATEKLMAQDNPMVAAVMPAPVSTVSPTEVNESAPVTASHEKASSVAGAGKPKTFVGEEYIRANFGAIRDSILAKLRYPLIARRRGWSGQVEVAFKIAPDGSVSDLRVKASSGYPVLDEQALAAVHRSAPFTPPRVVANVVMPVTFQLN